MAETESSTRIHFIGGDNLTVVGNCHDIARNLDRSAKSLIELTTVDGGSVCVNQATVAYLAQHEVL